jgi:hypothetical protein
MFRSLLAAIAKRIHPREGLLDTWWLRVLAFVAVALLMALVVSFIMGAG